MKNCRLLLIALMVFICVGFTTCKPEPEFKVLIVASADPDHEQMINYSKPFFEKLGNRYHFAIDFTKDASTINIKNLAQYRVCIQFNLAPFEMSNEEQAALQQFIEQGKGWIGVHAAGLTGTQFIDSSIVYWQWFENFFGGVVYTPHPSFQKGSVIIEDCTHPVTVNLPPSFTVWDEWYEFDKSPRSNVHVLACADESSYTQTKPMGDHPIIWTNERYNRMVYIGIGHDSSLCADPNYTKLMGNAIIWAASGYEHPTNKKD